MSCHFHMLRRRMAAQKAAEAAAKAAEAQAKEEVAAKSEAPVKAAKGRKKGDA